MPEWFGEEKNKFLYSVGDVYISGTEHKMKLKFSMQAHLTHINTILKDCYASVIIDNADVLY